MNALIYAGDIIGPGRDPRGGIIEVGTAETMQEVEGRLHDGDVRALKAMPGMTEERVEEIMGLSTAERLAIISGSVASEGAFSSVEYDVTLDPRFLGLVNQTTAEAMEFGDADAQEVALKVCAKSACRKLGLPEVMGEFIDLRTDSAIVQLLGAELDRDVSHTAQEANGFGRRFHLFRTAVEDKYADQPDTLDDFRSKVRMSGEDMVQRGQTIRRSLGELTVDVGELQTRDLLLSVGLDSGYLDLVNLGWPEVRKIVALVSGPSQKINTHLLKLAVGHLEERVSWEVHSSLPSEKPTLKQRIEEQIERVKAQQRRLGGLLVQL